jgi:hypothetical protein
MLEYSLDAWNKCIKQTNTVLGKNLYVLQKGTGITESFPGIRELFCVCKIQKDDTTIMGTMSNRSVYTIWERHATI